MAAQAHTATAAASYVTMVASSAAAATAANKAMSAEATSAAIAANAAAATATLASIDASEAHAIAMTDASLAAANAYSDAVFSYIGGALPAQLTAEIAAIDASLARQQTGISAVTTARTSAAGAGLTKTLADLDAALTAANEAAALDDPVAIAAASRDAAAAVAAAWQEVNNINTRAAETFAGQGPGSFAMSVAGFMGWAGEWGDIIWAGIGGFGQGFLAAANGFIPFFDPFDSFYDPADETLQWSQFFGSVSAAALAAAGLLAAAPVLAGAATLPYRVSVTFNVQLSRFFATATQYRAVVTRSVFNPLVSRLGLQWHHWAIPNSVGIAAGGGLNRLAQAGWNLFPIPAGWNGYIGNGGFWYVATGTGIGTSPVWVPWSIGELGEWLFGNED